MLRSSFQCLSLFVGVVLLAGCVADIMLDARTVVPNVELVRSESREFFQLNVLSPTGFLLRKVVGTIGMIEELGWTDATVVASSMETGSKSFYVVDGSTGIVQGPLTKDACWSLLAKLSRPMPELRPVKDVWSELENTR